MENAPQIITTRPLALVTGAGRREGIGYEVARQLAARGFGVLLTARRGETAQARAGELCAEGLEVRAAALDVTDPKSIAAVVSRVEREHGRLDVLINNAAVTGAFGEGPSGADLTAARAAMEATLFGSWQTTQALLPLLRNSQSPRIVMVSSGAGSHGDRAFGLESDNAMGPGYAVSKAALNALCSAFARELRGAALVNAVCPGFTATFPGAETMGARPVAEGAASVVWAALLPDTGPTGGFFRDGQPLPW